MTFSTLMVHLELEQSNDARLRIAGDLAEQFDAKVIGIAASDPKPTHYAGGSFAQSLVAQNRSKIKKQITETEERFRSAMHQRARDIEWRSALARPTDYVTHEVRAADLVITGVNRDGPLLDPLRRLDPSDLVMRVGRPGLCRSARSRLSQAQVCPGRLEGYARGAPGGRGRVAAAPQGQRSRCRRGHQRRGQSKRGSYAGR